MNDFTCPREKSLGAITLILGLIVWIGLILGTFGIALIALAFGFLLYLFAQSALIAHIKGNGVELSERQFPELYQQFTECCQKLQFKKNPQIYILNGDGGLNAFATRFLGAQYVVLMSDIVDAMDEHDDGVRFYIGHELGHLHLKHLSGHLLRWPALWLPLIGAAYARSCETSCDLHGLACSKSPAGAAKALAALAAGPTRWKKIDLQAYQEQANSTTGFWMSFHELTAGYPWLNKRAARVLDTSTPSPKRNPFAYLLALFVPYAGRLGAGFGFLIAIYIIGILAAIAIPAYQDYVIRASVMSNVMESQTTRNALKEYYESNKQVPTSLEAVNLPSQLPNGSNLSLDPERMILSIKTKQGELIFTPTINDDGLIIWTCSNGDGLKLLHLPKTCRASASSTP